MSNIWPINSQVLGFRSRVPEDPVLLVCDTVSMGNLFPTFTGRAEVSARAEIPDGKFDP
jgi:hypothetical protein